MMEFEIKPDKLLIGLIPCFPENALDFAHMQRCCWALIGHASSTAAIVCTSVYEVLRIKRVMASAKQGYAITTGSHSEI